MPVNPEFAGRVYPPSAPYGVSAAKIKEFAEAVGATDPAHTDRAAAPARGYRDVIAPPTFAVLVAQRAEMELVSYTHLDVYKRQLDNSSVAGNKFVDFKGKPRPGT